MSKSGSDRRVLITIGCLDIGGAERRFLELIKHLRAKAARIHVAFFVISGREGRLDNDFRAAGCDIYYGQPGISGLINLARLCLKTHPDIFHANSETAAGFYGLVARLMGVPRIISHMHTSREIGYSRTVRDEVYEWFTCTFSDIIVGVSKASMADKSFGKVPQRVIYNGIELSPAASTRDTSPPQGFGGSGPDFIFLGRLDRCKNIPHAIAAFRLFVERHGANAGRLHVVGPDGNVSSNSLRALARDAGIEHRVYFHGPTSEPLRFLHHADCVLLPSDFEGLSGVTLEALSCGTPIISSEIPSMIEVKQNAIGLMVVAVSDVEGWVQCMSQALDMDRNVIKNHFWRNSPFSMDRFAGEIADLWQISNPGPEA